MKNAIVFNYNKFILNKNDYQYKLNKKLGLKKPIIAVSHASQGSSFNKGSNKVKNNKNYLLRYKKINNNIIKTLLKDKKILKILKDDFEISL